MGTPYRSDEGLTQKSADEKTCPGVVASAHRSPISAFRSHGFCKASLLRFLAHFCLMSIKNKDGQKVQNLKIDENGGWGGKEEERREAPSRSTPPRVRRQQPNFRSVRQPSLRPAMVP